MTWQGHFDQAKQKVEANQKTYSLLGELMAQSYQVKKEEKCKTKKK